MPYLKIQTNTHPAGGIGNTVLQEASRLVSEQLGKSEAFFMGAFEPGVEMLFAGSAAPVAFVELKALGLPGAKTRDLSRLLCDLVEDQLGVPKNRIYIKFHDVSRGMWGWNGETI